MKISVIYPSTLGLQPTQKRSYTDFHGFQKPEKISKRKKSSKKQKPKNA